MTKGLASAATPFISEEDTLIQVIGTLVTDGQVLSLGLAAGFEKLPLETQRDILRFCARFIDATVNDMDEEIEALTEGAAVEGEAA